MPQTVILKEAVACIATRVVRPRAKAGRNLYPAFIDQNVNASRILIVESAFDPCNGGPESGRIRPGQRADTGYPGLDENGRRLICIRAARLGVHRKARSENFQGLQDTC